MEEKFHTWTSYKPLAALWDIHIFQVRTKMAELFPTWLALMKCFFRFAGPVQANASKSLCPTRGDQEQKQILHPI